MWSLRGWCTAHPHRPMQLGPRRHCRALRGASLESPRTLVVVHSLLGEGGAPRRNAKVQPAGCEPRAAGETSQGAKLPTSAPQWQLAGATVRRGTGGRLRPPIVTAARWWAVWRLEMFHRRPWARSRSRPAGPFRFSAELLACRPPPWRRLHDWLSSPPTRPDPAAWPPAPPGLCGCSSAARAPPRICTRGASRPARSLVPAPAWRPFGCSWAAC